MADLGTLASGPIAITLGGASYLVSPRPLKALGEMQAWFKRSIPGPLAKAAEAIDAADRAGVVLSRWAREAAMDAAAKLQARWPPRIGSIEWLDAIDREEAAWVVIRHALEPHQPGMTEAEAKRLADLCTPTELVDLVGAIFWGLDPKAPGSPATGADASPIPTTPQPGSMTGTP